jgi:two-component sensor histidine kinase/ligand-binding sensor domain-containing protein
MGYKTLFSSYKDVIPYSFFGKLKWPPFLVLFLFFCHSTQAQEYNFKTYSVNDGLPQAQVHDLAQTRDGYIWMATYGGGLVKFDGKDFFNYTMENGLKDNSVEQILRDSNDNIWVATSKGGVATFQGDSLIYPIRDDSLNHYPVTGIDKLRDGKMCFGTWQGGAFFYDGKNVSRLTTSDGLLSNTIWDFFEDDDGSIWMATQNGIAIYKDKELKSYTLEDGLSGRKTYKIIERENGDKWIATSNGVSVFDGQSFDAITVADGDSLNSVFDILESSDGRIWIGTEANGVFVLSKNDIRHITKENGLSSNNIYKFFEDKQHHIWIATDGDGVNLYKDDGFVFYSNDSASKDYGILSIYKDQNNVFWFGTTYGIESFDGQSFTSHPLPKKYRNPNVWNIVGLPDGDKLVTMPDNSLMRYDGKTFTDFLKDYDLGNLFVYDLYIDSDNYLWICAETGLFELSLDTHDVRKYTSEDGMADDTVYYIYEDDEGIKWIGTLYGLSIFDGKHFKNIRVSDGLGHDEINYITEGPGGNIWLGTGGGVSEFKPGSNGKPAEVNNFDKSDGMVLVNTHFLWFDNEGYLWQGTNGGLQMLDVPTYEKTGTMNIAHYSLSNEGVGLEFNYHALEPDDHGGVWMGSMRGAVYLNPAKLKRFSTPPALNLTNITLNSLPLNWHDYQDTMSYHNGMFEFKPVEFSYGQNVYGFNFMGLSYENPENVMYRFKLKGFEQDWMPVTKHNSAIYTNLGPGNYTFIVEAKNAGANYSKSISYYFSVAYPFWRTYWFYGLVILGLIGVVYVYTRIRIHFLEKNRLKELVDEQTQDLKVALEEKEVLVKEIHHRVKNNLAVISGLLELQVDYAADDFSSKILRESQRRIQSISMIHEKLYQNDRLAEIDFSKYIRELVDVITYSNSQFNKKIEVKISTGDVRLGVDQGIPCGLIVNELISNAFEHAFRNREEGKIWVAFKKIDDSNVRLSVRDNGIGLPDDFEAAQVESKSLGMVLIRTLTNQLRGKLDIIGHDSGTEFIVDFKKEEPPLTVPISNN